MIRTVMTCDRDGCQAIYRPDVDSGADVLERAARALGWRRLTAMTHACPACATDRGPAGDVTPADMSHAMLIAILMHHGGAMELPAGAFDRDALGGIDGSWHAVAMQPLPGTGTIRISVQPRPAGDAGGITKL